MRILFLTHRIPFPPNKGDKIRSFNFLRHLVRRHEVCVGSLIDDAVDVQHVGEVAKLVQSFVFARIDSPARRLLAFKSLHTGHPITVDHFYSRDLQRQIDGLLEAREFDAVLCYSSPMAEYLFRSRHRHARLRSITKLMDLIDIDSYKWRQYAADSPKWKAWIYRREASTLAEYERHIARHFDKLFVVSEQERDYFPGGPPGHLHAISNGVDVSFFSPEHITGEAITGRALVFTGVMDYWPNVEGVKWFVESVWPKIEAAAPDVRLFLVGSRPTPEIRSLASDKIIVTGFVQDVREYLASASVCIVPLRIARGVQNKVLEAMAMAKAVVSTPQAFEGLQVRPGEGILVAPDEASFAAAVIELLQDPAKAQAIGRAARACVEEHYTWERRFAALEKALGPHVSDLGHSVTSPDPVSSLPK